MGLRYAKIDQMSTDYKVGDHLPSMAIHSLSRRSADGNEVRRVLADAVHDEGCGGIESKAPEKTGALQKLRHSKRLTAARHSAFTSNPARDPERRLCSLHVSRSTHQSRERAQVIHPKGGNFTRHVVRHLTQQISFFRGDSKNIPSIALVCQLDTGQMIKMADH